MGLKVPKGFSLFFYFWERLAKKNKLTQKKVAISGAEIRTLAYSVYAQAASHLGDALMVLLFRATEIIRYDTKVLTDETESKI